MTKLEAGLPEIWGHFEGNTNDPTLFEKTGCFFVEDPEVSTGADGCEYVGGYIGFAASRCSAIYRDDCTTVQPSAMTVNYYVRAR